MQYSFLSCRAVVHGPPAWNSLLRIALVEAVSSALSILPAPRRENIGLALSAIARTVAESLELKDVFSRVAEAARQVLPFEIMGISVVHDTEVPWEDMENVTFSAFAVAGELRADEI